MIDRSVAALVAYGIRKNLVLPEDGPYVTNQILERLQLSDYSSPEPMEGDIHSILQTLTDYACKQGLIGEDIVCRDLFDTGLMGCLVPRPSEIRREFWRRYAISPKAATDFFYQLCKDTNYIRWDRIAKNLSWQAETEFGSLDITINLSKPEKPTTSLADVQAAPKGGYPKCLLCPENEGYAGHYRHPARQNHRLIPLTLDGEPWYLQYSPYVYYNEHCIVFSQEHTPMRIDGGTFRKLLDFVTQFPHYFMGSNSDLPIVGGSIFTHAHFQGGCYVFPMEKARVEKEVNFSRFPQIRAGIVRWPMNVIRLQGNDKEQIAALAEIILSCWRGYSDEQRFVFAETDGIPHNTITPIARRRGEAYELDLVLRNNITTEDYPLGVYHAHPERHHIKKENIGLIEVLGLAVLPPRLKKELSGLAQALVHGSAIDLQGPLGLHASWATQLRERHTFTPENVQTILRQEVGRCFGEILGDAGVFKPDADGQAGLRQFIAAVNSCQ